jgi:REP element-mobilizing transposase RayT
MITADLKPDLLAYIGGIIRELDGKLLAADGTSDHVHLLMRLPPKLSLADGLRVIKTNSSRWVRETHRQFRWQAGYAAFSVSESNLPAVARYIRNQEQHHRRISFQEELRACLKKHRIEYDERYIWE